MAGWVTGLQARSITLTFLSDGSNARTALYLRMCTGHKRPVTGYAATACWYSGEGLVQCPVCVEVEALITAVWAVWHSGRMCSSLRNSLVLLAGEGGPAMTANKGTDTHTHTLQDKNMHYVNKPPCVCLSVCVRTSIVD